MRRAYAAILVVLFAGSVAARAAEGEEAPKAISEERGDPGFMGRNVRIEFRLVPEDKPEEPSFIVTAVRKYAMNTRFRNGNQAMTISINGEISLADGDQFLVMLEAMMEFSGDEGEGQFRASGGVLVKPGEERAVTRMGDKTMMVKASYADPAPVAP